MYVVCVYHICMLFVLDCHKIYPPSTVIYEGPRDVNAIKAEMNTIIIIVSLKLISTVDFCTVC